RLARRSASRHALSPAAQAGGRAAGTQLVGRQHGSAAKVVRADGSRPQAALSPGSGVGRLCRLHPAAFSDRASATTNGMNMSDREFENYLTLLASLLRLDPKQRGEIGDELRSHL